MVVLDDATESTLNRIGAINSDAERDSVGKSIPEKETGIKLVAMGDSGGDCRWGCRVSRLVEKHSLNPRAMTYTVHVFGLGEVCRVPSSYYQQAHQFFNAYAQAGLPVMLFRDGVCLRSYAA